MVVSQILSLMFWGVQKTFTFFTPDFFQIFYAGFILNILYSVTWMLSAKLRDATLVNFLWGLGIAVQSLLYFFKSLDYTIFSFFSEKFSWEKLTFTTIMIAHGLIHSAYLIIRELGHGEDKRYAALREKLGGNFWWLSYFIVFMPLFSLNMMMGLTIYAFDNSYKSDISSFYYWLGIVTMICGGVFSTLADLQKYNFLHNKRNEGKVVDVGLWSLSRHPNYFGTVLFWWGAYLVNFSAGILWTIVCPIVFSFSILFLTGIPVNERLMLSEQGDKYKEYQNNVPAFIPNLLSLFKKKQKISLEMKLKDDKIDKQSLIENQTPNINNMSINRSEELKSR
jgi:steroid 5-alpha reductase family enzyme